MKKSEYHIFNRIAVSIFAAFIFLNIFISNGEYSTMENRYLQGVPELSAENIMSRKFMEESENYSGDQLMLRNFFVKAKAYAERLTGRKENNGVYFAKDNYLIEKPSAPDEEIVKNNIKAITSLAAAEEFKVSVCVIPQSFEILKKKLPKGVYTPVIPELNSIIEENLKNTKASYVDAVSPLEKNKDKYIFYRTDHHQTTEGSYLIYEALGKECGYTPMEENSFKIETVSDEFLGTSYSKALIGTKKDTIKAYKTKINEAAFVELGEDGEKSNSMFFPEHLESKDKYSYFLDGNHAVSVIRNGEKNGKSIALIKDSYAHSLAPFLINHFENIYLIDMRYFQGNPITYLRENGVSQVLILYGSSTFMTDSSISKLTAFMNNDEVMQAAQEKVKEYGLVKENTPVKDEYFSDAVFLGDSLTESFRVYSGITNATFLCATSMSINGMYSPGSDGMSFVQKAKASSPGKIYVMLGVNEDITPENKPAVMAKYSQLIDTLKVDNPHAEIYIQSILPVSAEREASGRIKNAAVYDYNNTLLEMAREKQAYFIDVYKAVTDENGFMRAELTSDGVHLGVDGCKLWADYLRKHTVLNTSHTEKTALSKETAAFKQGKYNLQEIFQKLEKEALFSEGLGETNPKTLLQIHSIDEALVVNAYGVVGGGATAEEAALFEAKNDKAAERIEILLKEYVKMRKSSFEGYIPQELPKLNSAVIYKKDNFICLLVANEYKNVKKILKQEVR